MDSPETVVDALRLLRDAGYETEFQLVDGHLCWGGDAGSCAADSVEVDRLYRFEGDSDPGDEMVVFALHYPGTGTRGVLATGFGSAADPAVMEHLTGFASRLRPFDPLNP